MAFRQGLLVARVVVVEGGRVLLAHHRHPDGRDFWCFPGGHVETGESWAEAARREVAEETGLQIELIDVVYAQDFPRPPGPDGAELFFRARIEEGHLRLGREPGLDAVQWVPLSELSRREVLPQELADAVQDGRWNRWSIPLPRLAQRVNPFENQARTPR